ncbi:MAG: tyrosine-type recombinase/integrase [SAR324 cluster bacterium]|nr:tyrosine-type recombinase/integrase [SAR324 cluster bacterium]MBL7034953.1 tyrosine-type recombinase/integrase [SAR324 cluster bacterium]
MQPLVSEFLDSLKSKKYASNSIQSHRLDLRKFLQWLEIDEEDSDSHKLLVKIRKLSLVDLETYLALLRESYKPRTLARHISSLKLFLDHLELSGLIKTSPAHQLRFPEVLPDAPEILSPEEVIALLEAPSLTHYLGLRDRAMLELLYSSGLKVNELLGLDVEDLYLDLDFLKVRSKRERMVPMTSTAVEVMRNYLEQARESRLLHPADSCLFPSRNGTRMSRVGFWAMIKKQARRAGITSRINPRILRHSFAVHLLQNGIDLSDIRDLFGYVSLDATLQYAHVNRPDYFAVYHELHPRGKKHTSAE